MDKQTVIVLSVQQRDDIIFLLDGTNPNKARHVANFLEKIEPQDLCLASAAQAEIDELKAKIKGYTKNPADKGKK